MTVGGAVEDADEEVLLDVELEDEEVDEVEEAELEEEGPMLEWSALMRSAARSD